MGEEYGEENPFPFFCSFEDPGLVQAVREGRKKEFDAFAWQGEIPDPQGEETFASAKLSWSWPDGTPRAGLRRLYRDLLTARREWPALRDFENRSARLVGDGAMLELVRGGRSSAGSVRAVFNLGDRAVRLADGLAGERSVLFRSEAPEYGGSRREGTPADELAPFEFIVLGPPAWRAFPE
jgi:maltooligosyltrehalose trehalohydrolase